MAAQSVGKVNFSINQSLYWNKKLFIQFLFYDMFFKLIENQRYKGKKSRISWKLNYRFFSRLLKVLLMLTIND